MRPGAKPESFFGSRRGADQPSPPSLRLVHATQLSQSNGRSVHFEIRSDDGVVVLDDGVVVLSKVAAHL